MKPYQRLVAGLIVASLCTTGCSKWKPYRQRVDTRYTEQVSAPFREDGACVERVESTETITYDVPYRFRIGADMYVGATLLAMSWLFLGIGLAERAQRTQDGGDMQKSRDLMKTGWIFAGFSVPFWGYFFVQLFRKPLRQKGTVEEVVTSDRLEDATGCN